MLQMTITYPEGFSLTAILLAAYGNMIRVAIDGWDDAAEFRLIDGQWFSEIGEPVEIDADAGYSGAGEPGVEQAGVDQGCQSQGNRTAFPTLACPTPWIQQVPSPTLWVN